MQSEADPPARRTRPSASVTAANTERPADIGPTEVTVGTGVVVADGNAAAVCVFAPPEAAPELPL
jgi:hypothetical protein